MDETSQEKFERISRAVQSAILNGFPNPQRVGCPGQDVVREIAQRTDLIADETWEHITHCSPCYAIFLKFKKAARRRRILVRSGSLVLAAVACLVVVVLVTYQRGRQSNQLIAEWDLEATSVSRGITEGPAGVTAQHAQRALGRIVVHLPLGSDEGEYQLEIRKTEEGPSLRTGKGKGQILNGHTVLSVQVDLSNLPPAAYFAAIGRGNHTWRVYPLSLQ
jgi:hypothetical protein